MTHRDPVDMSLSYFTRVLSISFCCRPLQDHIPYSSGTPRDGVLLHAGVLTAAIALLILQEYPSRVIDNLLRPLPLYTRSRSSGLLARTAQHAPRHQGDIVLLTVTRNLPLAHPTRTS